MHQSAEPSGLAAGFDNSGREGGPGWMKGFHAFPHSVRRGGPSGPPSAYSGFKSVDRSFRHNVMSASSSQHKKEHGRPMPNRTKQRRSGGLTLLLYQRPL